jgi:hypothetical protein
MLLEINTSWKTVTVVLDGIYSCNTFMTKYRSLSEQRLSERTVFIVCYLGTGLWEQLFTHSGTPTGCFCVCVCEILWYRETSPIKRPRPELSYFATVGKGGHKLYRMLPTLKQIHTQTDCYHTSG